MSEYTSKGKGRRVAGAAATLALVVASGCSAESSSEQPDQPDAVQQQQFGAIVCGVFVRYPLLPDGERDMRQHTTMVRLVTEAGEEQLPVVGPNHGAHWRVAIESGRANPGDFVTAAAQGARSQQRLLDLVTQTGPDGKEWIVGARLGDPLAAGEQAASCS